MEMMPWGVHLDIAPFNHYGKCQYLRSCPYPGKLIRIWDSWTGVAWDQNICWHHLLSIAAPFSMEYQDADALVGVPHHRRAHAGSSNGNNSRKCSKDSVILKFDSHQWGKLSSTHSGTRFASVGKSKVVSVRRKREVLEIVAQRNEEREREIAHNVEVDSLIHWRDPVYSQFRETFDKPDRAFTLCGERASKGSISLGESMPTCDVCYRMVLTQRAQKWQEDQLEKRRSRGGLTIADRLAEIARRRPSPIVELRPGIVTPPKPKEKTLSFEEMLEEGTMGFDPEAFFNRRNWGERRGGGAFYDPESGTQERDKKGDWRHKRGGVNHLAACKRKRH